MTKLEKMAIDHATFDFNRVGVFEKMTSTTHAESFIEGFRAAIETLDNAGWIECTPSEVQEWLTEYMSKEVGDE